LAKKIIVYCHVEVSPFFIKIDAASKWHTLFFLIRGIVHSQLTLEVLMDELNKASFLADFFCSELAVEVYKDSVRGVNVTDRAVYLINFAERLWQEVKESISDDEGENWGVDL